MRFLAGYRFKVPDLKRCSHATFMSSILAHGIYTPSKQSACAALLVQFGELAFHALLILSLVATCLVQF